MRPLLLDLKTGKRAYGEDNSVYYWTEGNGSCDCNRAGAFDVDDEMDTEMREKHPELKEHQGYCYGYHRFIVIAVKGNQEDIPDSDIIREANNEYWYNLNESREKKKTEGIS